MSPAAPSVSASWLERIAAPANLAAAWDKVRRNDGAPGVDGVTIAAFEHRFSQEGPQLRESLLRGRYQPHPVRAVDVPKAAGGLRTLGIPTVEDRVVQQAIAQVLTPVWEVLFSPSSHAYRRGHDAHDAVAQVQQFLAQGAAWVVDLDIEAFFNHIHHERLLEQIRAQVPEDGVLALVRAFLESGVVRGGYRLPTTEGTPQGSPLSPLLANITLNELDQHLEERCCSFARYADDLVILCTTEPEAHAALEDARTFLAGHLNLKLNEAKTRICSPAEVTFLGFSFRRDAAGAWHRVISAASMEAFRAQVEEITARGEGTADMETLLRELASYVHGWENYYRHAETATAVKQLRAHARTAVRRLLWRLWATPERRVQELVRRGISPEVAGTFVRTCPDAATAAAGPVLGGAVPNAFFLAYGLGKEPAPAALPYGVPAPAPHPAGRRAAPAPVAPKPAAPHEEQAPGILRAGERGLHIGGCLALGRLGFLRCSLDFRLAVGAPKTGGAP